MNIKSFMGRPLLSFETGRTLCLSIRMRILLHWKKRAMPNNGFCNSSVTMDIRSFTKLVMMHP